MHNIPEWLPLTAEWITALATALTLLSLLMVRKQLKADHERSRRERSIDLMSFWCQYACNSRPYYVCGRRMVEKMDRDQCEALSLANEVRIDPKYAYLLEAFRADFSNHLPKPLAAESKLDPDKQAKSASLVLNRAESLALRMVTVSYLNNLETVATAWRHNVADREIIEEEFKKIVSPETNTFILESYRQISGSYPSLEALVLHIIDKNNTRKAKPPTA